MTFDAEHDVICVGSGAAGSVAALSASWAGADTVLLEKDPKVFGGTTNKSGGTFWIPNNPLMQAAGMQDNKEDALHFLAQMSFPNEYSPDKEHLGLSELSYRWIEQYYDVGPQMCAELQERGVVGLVHPKFLDSGQAEHELVLDYTEHPRNLATTGRMLGSGMPIFMVLFSEDGSSGL